MVRRSSLLRAASAAALLCAPAAGRAAETVKYIYDAKGRLVRVERSGDVNNGVRTEYSHDKADNRSRVTVSGSSNPAPPPPPPP